MNSRQRERENEKSRTTGVVECWAATERRDGSLFGARAKGSVLGAARNRSNTAKGVKGIEVGRHSSIF